MLITLLSKLLNNIVYTLIRTNVKNSIVIITLSGHLTSSTEYNNVSAILTSFMICAA